MSLVFDLQSKCLDRSVPTIDVVRFASVVARKLQVQDLRIWAEQELNGYTQAATIPDYRIVHMTLEIQDLDGRWLPAVLNSTREYDAICKVRLSASLGALEAMLDGQSSNADICIGMPLEMQQIVMKAFRGCLPRRHAPTAHYKAILDHARNAVLDWSLKLEEQGIKGEGMTFSDDEKKTAAQAHYTINYNGSVGTSLIQQASNGSVQSVTTGVDAGSVQKFIDAVKESLDKLEVSQDDKQQLTSDIASVQSQLSSPKPSKVVIVECLKSARNVLEGASGSMVAEGLLKILPSLWS